MMNQETTGQVIKLLTEIRDGIDKGNEMLIAINQPKYITGMGGGFAIDGPPPRRNRLILAGSLKEASEWIAANESNAWNSIPYTVANEMRGVEIDSAQRIGTWYDRSDLDEVNEFIMAGLKAAVVRRG